MLAEKILNTKKVRLSESAYEQFEIASKEVDKLSEMSSESWGMITDRYYDNITRFTLVEGIVIGLGIAGCLYIGDKILTKVKHQKKK